MVSTSYKLFLKRYAYTRLQNSTGGHRVNEPYDCTHSLPISKGLPYLIASHTSLTSPSDQLWEDVDAALPLGAGYGKYFILEVHYDNVEHMAGVVDSSGFEVGRCSSFGTKDIGRISSAKGALTRAYSHNITT